MIQAALKLQKDLNVADSSVNVTANVTSEADTQDQLSTNVTQNSNTTMEEGSKSKTVSEHHRLASVVWGFDVLTKPVTFRSFLMCRFAYFRRSRIQPSTPVLQCAVLKMDGKQLLAKIAFFEVRQTLH